jgi:CRISPR-associated exonuclease Cas4
MKRGQKFHEKQIRNYSRRKNKSSTGKVLHFQQSLFSDKFNLFGVADLIVEYEGSLDIIEFKSSKGGTRAAVVQAGAYAIMAQEKFNKPVDEITIYTGDYSKPFISDFDNELKSEVLEVVRLTRNCLGSDILPLADPPLAKCSQCEFLRWCNDRM